MGNEGGEEGTNHVEQIFAWLWPLAVPVMGIWMLAEEAVGQRHVKRKDSGLTVEAWIYAGQSAVFVPFEKMRGVSFQQRNCSSN